MACGTMLSATDKMQAFRLGLPGKGGDYRDAAYSPRGRHGEIGGDSHDFHLDPGVALREEAPFLLPEISSLADMLPTSRSRQRLYFTWGWNSTVGQNQDRFSRLVRAGALEAEQGIDA